MKERAYMKTTWINNESIVDAQKLNKIESALETLENTNEAQQAILNNKIDRVTKENAKLVFSSGNTKLSEVDLSNLIQQGPQGPTGPKGDKGQDGVTPNISVGNVMTLAPGQNASITRRGTNSNPVFDFNIPKGEVGPQGPKGEKGEAGSSISIRGTVASESQLPTIGEGGDGWLINGSLYVWDLTTNSWINVGNIQGPKGQDGKDGKDGKDNNFIDVILLPKNYGLTGNDITTSLQACLDLCKNKKGGTILVPAGEYLLSTSLRIHANTTLILDKGATITATSNCPTMLINGVPNQSYGAYQAPGNITIVGGTWISNSPEYSESNRNIFGLAKACDITIRDANFYNVKSSHALDISGCKNVLVDNCNFKGYKNVEDGSRDYAEAIQLAEHTQAGFNNFPSYDRTPCENVVVQNCYFGASDYYEAWAVGVGGHSSVHNKNCKDIKIINNTFDGLTKSGIRIFKWKDVSISNNTFNECALGVTFSNVKAGAESSKDENGIQSNQSQAGENVTISGNKFNNSPMYISGQYTSETDFAPAKNITITDNIFIGSRGGNGLSLYVAQNVVVSNNIIKDCNRFIFIKYVANLVCNHNIANNINTEFIFSNEETDSVIYDNGYTNNIFIHDNKIDNVGRSAINLRNAYGFSIVNNCINNACYEEFATRPYISINTSGGNGRIESNYTTDNTLLYNTYGVYVTGAITNVSLKDNKIDGINGYDYITSVSIPKVDKNEHRVLNAIDFGAIANGEYDNTTVVQLMLDYAKTLGGATIYFPRHGLNKYRIKSYCFVYSNTTIKLEDGVEIIKNKGDLGALFGMGIGKTTSEYGSGAKNITIEGGTFRGYENSLSMSIHKVQNLTVRNTKFYDCVYSGHVLDLMGCDNVLVDNCIFQGFDADKANQNNRLYTEAIQIDCSTRAGAGSTFGDMITVYDGLPTKNVTVQNCKTLPIRDSKGVMLKFAPTLIGNHGYVQSKYFENIVIRNNYFEDCLEVSETYNNTGSWLRFYSTNGLIIEGNTFVNKRKASCTAICIQTKTSGTKLTNVGKSEIEPGDVYTTPQPNKDVKIIGNTFRGFDAPEIKPIVKAMGYPVVTVNNQGIEETKNHYAENIIISDNNFIDCWDSNSTKGSTASGDCIYLKHVRDATVSGNTCRNVRRLVYTELCNSIAITGNSGFGIHYVWLSLNQTYYSSVTGNSFTYVTGGPFINQCYSIVISGNIMSMSDYELANSRQSGIRVKTSNHISITGNVINNYINNGIEGILVYEGSTNIRIDNNTFIKFDTDYTVEAGCSNVKVDGKFKEPGLGYTWNSIGDSITRANGYQPHVMKNTGLRNYNNYGFSGYTATIKSKGDTTSVALKAAEFDKADIHTIFLGTNDFSKNCSIGKIGDATGTLNSFYGGLKQIIVDIYAKNKEAVIIFISPLKRDANGYTWSSTNDAGHKLSDYRDAIKEFCDYYSLGFLDLYSIGQINNNTKGKFLSDGLHPNDKGHYMISKIIADEINKFI